MSDEDDLQELAEDMWTMLNRARNDRWETDLIDIRRRWHSWLGYREHHDADNRTGGTDGAI